MSPDFFEPLNTDRLLIRRMTIDDSEVFINYRCLHEVSRYQQWRPQTVEEVAKFISEMETTPVEQGVWHQLSVCLLGTEEMIGDIGVHFPPNDPYQVEIGYTLAPQYWGRGYATEAARAVIDCLFSSFGKHHVFASVDPDNTASIAVLERLGMRKEAHFIKSMLIRGEWRDDCIYAVLREEWLQYFL